MIFRVARTQVELVLAGPSHRLGYTIGATYRALQPLAAAPLERPHRRPVESRRHLLWLVRHFLERDGDAPSHPALDSGSCFADLVGARLVPGFRPALAAELLPRLRRRDIHDIVGLAPLEPASDAALRTAGAARLVAAASAALCTDPSLVGATQPVVLARQAAVHLARAAGVHDQELRWALAISPRTTRRLAATSPPVDVLRAIRLHLSLETAALSPSRAA